MLSATFIARGVDALRNPKPAADAARPTLGMMSSLPDPVGSKVPSDAETVAKINGAVQVVGGLLLASGKMPRLTAAALALSVVPGSLGSHSFWKESDPQRSAQERREFLTDLSLIGGLIIAAADTEGKPSLAWRGRRAAHKVTASVAAALPAGAAASESIADSAVAEKLGHGLSVGAERGRELAEIARERAAELAHAAREHAPELAEAPVNAARTLPSGARCSPTWRGSAAWSLPTWHRNADWSLPTWHEGAAQNWPRPRVRPPRNSPKPHVRTAMSWRIARESNSSRRVAGSLVV